MKELFRGMFGWYGYNPADLCRLFKALQKKVDAANMADLERAYTGALRDRGVRYIDARLAQEATA